MEEIPDVEAETREELWALASQAYLEVFGRAPIAFDPSWQVEFLREYHSGVPDERTPESVRAVHAEIAARWPWLAVEAERQGRAYVRSLATHLEADTTWLVEALDEEPDLVRDELGWKVTGRSASLDVVGDAVRWQLDGVRGDLVTPLPWPDSQIAVVDSITGPQSSVYQV